MLKVYLHDMLCNGKRNYSFSGVIIFQSAQRSRIFVADIINSTKVITPLYNQITINLSIYPKKVIC